MKKITLTAEYCSKVGFAIGKSAEETKAIVNELWNKGYSINEIKIVLVNKAIHNGKKLCFVSSRGNN